MNEVQKKKNVSVNPNHALFSLVFRLGNTGLGFTLNGQVQFCTVVFGTAYCIAYLSTKFNGKT